MRAAGKDRPSGLIGRATARPGLSYRVVRAVCAGVGALLFRLQVDGLDDLPRSAEGRPIGGWICCGLPHRTWAEPFLLLFTLPAQPRIVMLGEGRTIFGSAWRAFLARRVGGLIPVWRGAGMQAFAVVLDAVRRALAARTVLAIFPEIGPPASPPALRRLSPGVARMAQHAVAPVVPVVFGGTHDLYLRRRIVVRFLPPIDPPSRDASPAAIDAWMADMLGRVAPAAEEAHRLAEAAPPRFRLWRRLHGPFPRTD